VWGIAGEIVHAPVFSDLIDIKEKSGGLNRMTAMRAVSRLVAFIVLATFAGIAPAGAWWRYAEWGLSESQLMTASSGQAVPCRPDVAVCARTANGAQPSLFVESVQMVGMPASVSFAFDAGGLLNQTIVLFANADFALIANLLQGIHGQPVEDRPGDPPVRVWRDDRRGSAITAVPSPAGVRLSYRPVNR
jgi:hypothetical protein